MIHSVATLAHDTSGLFGTRTTVSTDLLGDTFGNGNNLAGMNTVN